MKPRLKILQCLAIALLLLTGPLSANAAQPTAGDKAGPADTFGQEIRDLFDVKDLDVPPVVISGKMPHYPGELAKTGAAGHVVVEFIINRSGDVIATQVTESSRREFEMPALKSVQTWKFSPGKKDKHAVNVRMIQRLDFEAPKK